MNYQLSHYIVASEEVNRKGSRILLSTRSTRSVVVSKLCFEYLTTSRLDEIPINLVNKLIEAQILVQKEENELLTVVNENKKTIEDEKNTVLYEVIQPSAMCQLGCYYCGQKHTKEYLDHHLYEQLVQRVRMKVQQGNFKRLYIGWFGAEPLMGLKQMRELTPLLKKVATNFGMSYGAKVVTNGLSLKEGIFNEITRELSVDHIEVTLDGIASFHDEHRYTKEGGKSFDIIFQNLLNIFNKVDYTDYGCRITIRCNVDEKNQAGVSPLINLLAAHNLQYKLSSFYPIGVYSWGNDAHKQSLTKEEFAQRELGWISEMIRANFRPPSLIPSRVKQVCFSVSKVSELYDATGNIYDCSEVSYVPVYENEDYLLGNLKDKATETLSRSHLNNWNDTILTDQYPCHSCEMLPVCGGACPKSWHEGIRACPTNKFNIKDKLLMNYILGRPTKEESYERFKEIRDLHPKLGWLTEMELVFN